MSLRNQVYRLGANQVVSFTSTSVANTTAFQAGTNCVRVVATMNCHIRIGNTPTAVTTDAKLPPGVVEYFTVNPGEKIAAIRTTTSGSLYVAEVS